MLAVPQVTLATTLVGANLATLVAVIAVALELATTGCSPLWAPLVALPPLLVLGHLVPKALVQAHADRIVDPIAGPLRLASFVLRPIVFVVGGYAALLTRITHTERRKAFVTRDELAMLIESEPTTDKPEISADEREMIANVFELSEYNVGDLMVPLSEVTALPEDAPILEAALEITDKQHSRMPIYRSRVDDIVGIVHVFDLLQAVTGGKEAATKTVAVLAHPPLYVPEKMKATDLLVQLQSEQQHLAIVVDEYGGATGIVTIEDLLEIIVGDIEDEYDHEPSPIKAEKPGVWRVEARTAVARVNARARARLAGERRLRDHRGAAHRAAAADSGSRREHLDRRRGDRDRGGERPRDRGRAHHEAEEMTRAALLIACMGCTADDAAVAIDAAIDAPIDAAVVGPTVPAGKLLAYSATAFLDTPAWPRRPRSI